jgi:CTP synthase
MNPYQHGEVYVTDDGAETDLDLGHYERFTNMNASKLNNITTGQVYFSIISKERKGEFLGATVQVIPHVTDEIKSRIYRLSPGMDVVIVEVGGTVGDIESLPFLEAVRQFGLEVGEGNICFVHLTLVPYISAAEELKTKPTQHSVARLREIGIKPHILVCRTEHEMPAGMKEKIALFCNVPAEGVIEERDVGTASIYSVPLRLREEGLERLLARVLKLPPARGDLRGWRRMVARTLRADLPEVTIAVTGKYTEIKDAYKSIRAALTHAAGEAGVRLKVEALDVESEDINRRLKRVDGILVPGGFGARGVEGKIGVTGFARRRRIPFLGICLGMQCAVVEFARSRSGLKEANSTEFDPDTPAPVISLMEEQKKIKVKGGTMRLGSYPCRLRKGSRAFSAYKKPVIAERHRHRYEFNNDYRERLEARGMVVSGLMPARDLVEIIELKDHPWFVAVQFHPEFKSRPLKAHPLFREFVRAAWKYRRSRRAPLSSRT